MQITTIGLDIAKNVFQVHGMRNGRDRRSENLYRLARDIRGIGFRTVDAIAMKLGIEKTAMTRAHAILIVVAAELQAMQTLIASIEKRINTALSGPHIASLFGATALRMPQKTQTDVVREIRGQGSCCGSAL